MGRGSESAIFEEVQKFRQVWLWILLAPAIIVQWFGAYQQLVLGKPFGTNPAPDGMILASLLIFGIGLPLFFIMLSLTTRVEKDGVYVRFWPLHRRFVKIPLESIKEFKARKYAPIGEYWGWGIRYRRGSKAYTVRGNYGVDILLENGRSLLIGSQRASELEKAIMKAKSETGFK